MREGLLDLNGFYMFNEKINKLEGEIDLMLNGSFDGEVYDYGSNNPVQKIRGHIVLDGDLAKLVFLKFPSESFLTNIFYNLNNPIKKIQSFSFGIDFKGEWQELPYQISYNKYYNLFMAQIDPSHIGVKNKAEIRLRV